MQGNSLDHLFFFLGKIENNENDESIGIIRPNDGEYNILTGKSFTCIDSWKFNGKGRLKTDLHESMLSCRDIKNIYVGIPCQACGTHMTKYYKETYGNTINWTYGNIFCNKNWQLFIDFITKKSRKRNVYYVGPGTHTNPEFDIKARFYIDPLLVQRWETEADDIKKSVTEWFSGLNIEKSIILFSAGPITKILIPHMMQTFQHSKNIYLDVGSALDMFLKGGTNRLYCNPNQPHANMVCSFSEGHTKKPYADITVLLTVYRRPTYLLEQLEAIANQSVPAKEIIILKNHFSDSIVIPEIPISLKERLGPIHVVESTKNFGVWGRFAIGLLANTTYVCVFDDDTIPGRRWFENCLLSMNFREGLYGTIGLVFHSDKYKNRTRYGWDNPTTEVKQVDIVGHAWFLKRRWLSWMWECCPDYNEYLKCGEDIALSCFLQKKGIPTFVPPHPPNELELYGSNPSRARAYGTDRSAISMEASSPQNFDRALKRMIQDFGFNLLHEQCARIAKQQNQK